MAKVNSLTEFSGTFFGMTFVRSKQYGYHVRAPRGSKSPVRLNDAFIASAELMKKANVYARIIRNAIKPHHGDQHDGTLWIRLIKFFRKQLKNNGAIDLHRLKSFLMFANPLANVLHVRKFDIAVDDALRVDVSYGCPVFVTEVGATDYEFGVIVIFLKDDSTFLCDEYASIKQKLVKSEKPLFYSCVLPISKEARTAIVIFKCLAWLNGQKPSCANAGMGMEVCEVIDLKKNSSDR